MGFFSTHWVGEFKGHKIEVVRKVGGHQFELLIDDHGSAVCDEVWELYRFAIERLGPLPTLIEWDTNIPALSRLVAEGRRADLILGERRVAA